MFCKVCIQLLDPFSVYLASCHFLFFFTWIFLCNSLFQSTIFDLSMQYCLKLLTFSFSDQAAYNNISRAVGILHKPKQAGKELKQMLSASKLEAMVMETKWYNFFFILCFTVFSPLSTLFFLRVLLLHSFHTFLTSDPLMLFPLFHLPLPPVP